MNHARFLNIIAGKDRSLSASLWRAGLLAASAAYRGVISSRNAMFNLGLRRVHDLGRPAISIGNLTAGGTGKTPMVIEVACRLLNMGKRPAVLMRGYHAQEGLSDEARLLAEALAPHVMVHTHPKRSTAATNALLADSGIDCFILDDAFQHRQAQRDLDILLIDATNPFGHDHMLPRGLLREPITGMRRAQGVVITRADLVSGETLAKLRKRIESITQPKVLAITSFEWTGFRDASDKTLDLADLADKNVLGVCGVGNPEAFKKMLFAHFGQTPVEVMPDHHHYESAEIRSLFESSDFAQADAIITTEKDWVKWRQFMPEAGWPLPVYRPVLGVKWLEGEDAFEALLQTFDGQSQH